jgi:hypothetical protein
MNLQKFKAKSISFFVELLLYSLVFIVLEDASLTTALKAAIVLAIFVRIFVAYFGKKN